MKKKKTKSSSGGFITLIIIVPHEREKERAKRDNTIENPEVGK